MSQEKSLIGPLDLNGLSCFTQCNINKLGGNFQVFYIYIEYCRWIFINLMRLLMLEQYQGQGKITLQD